MPPSIPRPATLIGAAGKGVDAIEQAITLVPRLIAVVTEVETLLTRVQDVVTAIELTQQRAQAVVERTEVVVAEAATMTELAGPLVEQLAPLLQDSLPTLQQLEPMLRRITETTDPDEVAAMVSMVDLMPEVVGKFKTDILPVLDTLGTVAPDLRDLLDVSKELNELLVAVPGFGRVKRKVEEQQADQDTYRADEEPPSAPDRRA